MWVLLRNGRIVDPSQGLDRTADLLIENGRVSRIGQVDEPNLDSEGIAYDCSGQVITPDS